MLFQQNPGYAISLYGASAIKLLRRIDERRVLVKSDNPLFSDARLNWFGRDL